MAVTLKAIIPAKTAESAQTGCLEWTGFKSRDGYGIVQRKGKLLKVHRLVFCEANDKSLDDIKGLVVRHKCDNRACVNANHLEIGTNVDNTRDRTMRNRDARGSTNGNSKLVEADVVAIRNRYCVSSKENGAKQIAKDFNVSRSLVYQVVHREIWRHV